MAPLESNSILIRILKIGLKGIAAIALTAVAPIAIASPDGETGFVLLTSTVILRNRHFRGCQVVHFMGLLTVGMRRVRCSA